MTNDVELTSIPLNREEISIADEVFRIGLPRLLDLYSKHDVNATFYFTGNIVEIRPGLLDMVKERGHEIGCHGYNHDTMQAFDVLSYEKQVECLEKTKNIIENESNCIVKSFRAPEARINEDTIRALEKCGFTSDSSVASQRFDGPFSYGFRKKIFWLYAPRMPYHPSFTSTTQVGESKILEIPISALIFPFIGTTMRITPLLTRMLRRILFTEARFTNKPIVFLTHPNECLDIYEFSEAERRNQMTKNRNFLVDDVKSKIKLRNIGIHSVELIEEIIKSAKLEGFEFITASSYCEKYGGG
jgi:peptidoglycan/xylan/chitin deacetylase (PgdA/CDA1 family)